MSGNGRLHSFTVIHQPANPAFQDDVPYVYAMVQLDEGPRMIANLVDCAPAEAQVDMRLTAVFDDVTAGLDAGQVQAGVRPSRGQTARRGTAGCVRRYSRLKAASAPHSLPGRPPAIVRLPSSLSS